MLSTVFAAEAQFRLESGSRAREHAILGSIRNRKEELAAPAFMASATRQPASWPRPIGVRLELAEPARVYAVA
jgi:hypothetical protein